MLHNLILHVHHGEVSNVLHIREHESASNLIDQLKLVFHTDLGANHLEWLSQTTPDKNDDFKDNVSFAIPLTNPIIGSIVEGIRKNSIPNAENLVLSNSLGLSICLRAPPVA